MTLPYLGVEFPALWVPDDEQPEWWPWGSRVASQQDRELSDWRTVQKLLRAGSAFLEAPFPWS